MKIDRMSNAVSHRAAVVASVSLFGLAVLALAGVMVNHPFRYWSFWLVGSTLLAVLFLSIAAYIHPRGHVAASVTVLAYVLSLLVPYGLASMAVSRLDGSLRFLVCGWAILLFAAFSIAGVRKTLDAYHGR